MVLPELSVYRRIGDGRGNRLHFASSNGHGVVAEFHPPAPARRPK
jgi:hypothetical protein